MTLMWKREAFRESFNPFPFMSPPLLLASIKAGFANSLWVFLGQRPCFVNPISVLSALFPPDAPALTLRMY